MTTSRSRPYNRGDIFYVPFQFTDGSKALARPAVVVTAAAYHEGRNEVVIVGLTSNVTRAALPGQFEIQDWQAAGLRIRTAISGIIMTIHRSLLARYVGSLSSSDQASLSTSLRQVLEL